MRCIQVGCLYLRHYSCRLRKLSERLTLLYGTTVSQTLWQMSRGSYSEQTGAETTKD